MYMVQQAWWHCKSAQIRCQTSTCTVTLRPVADLEFSRLESWSRDPFLQVLVLVLNLGVLVLEPSSLGLGLGTWDSGAKVRYTAMSNGNCWNRTVVKHSMMFSVYCVQLLVCWRFCLPWLFVCHSSSQSWTASIGLVSLESRSWSWSWSWISKSWIQVC